LAIWEAFQFLFSFLTSKGGGAPLIEPP